MFCEVSGLGAGGAAVEDHQAAVAGAGAGVGLAAVDVLRRAVAGADHAHGLIL